PSPPFPFLSPATLPHVRKCASVCASRNPRKPPPAALSSGSLPPPAGCSACSVHLSSGAALPGLARNSISRSPSWNRSSCSGGWPLRLSLWPLSSTSAPSAPPREEAMSDAFTERLRMIRFRRKRERTTFRQELRIIPKWLVWICVVLYPLALV